MENNNFYLGSVFHRGKLRQITIDNLVLYTENDYYYLDLIEGKWYTTSSKDNDYVIKESLREVDISEFRTDYNYLLNSYKSKKKTKK